MHNLSRMKLGCRGELTAPIAQYIGAAEPVEAYGRITRCPRVTGQNDRYPDCVPTAYCNAIQTVKAWSGNRYPINDDIPLSIYKQFDPTLTLGMNPESLFAWAEKNNVAGYMLKSWSRMDHNDEDLMRSFIRNNGGVFLVVQLSTEQQTQKEWEPAGTAGSWGGHAVMLDSFDGAQTNGTSWGEPLYIDRPYFTAPGFVVGAYALDLVRA